MVMSFNLNKSERIYLLYRRSLRTEKVKILEEGNLRVALVKVMRFLKV